MSRTLVLVVSLALLLGGAVGGCVPATAQTPPHQVWKALYNGGGNESPRVVRASPADDRVYVTGHGFGSIETVAYNGAGKQLWSDRYTGGFTADPFDMVVSRDGKRIYVIGTGYKTAPPGGTADYLTIAYSAAGARLWVARYDDAHHGDDRALAVAVSPNGRRIYVTGESFAGRTSICGFVEHDQDDVATVAYSRSGDQLWVRTYDSPAQSNDVGRGVAVDTTTGNVVVSVGASDSCRAQIVVFSYRSDGRVLWKRVIDGPHDVYPVNGGIAVDAAARKIFVAGMRRLSNDGFAFLLGAYSTSTGTPLWTRTYSDRHVTLPQAFAIGPAGHLYLAGQTTSSFIRDPVKRWETVAYDGDGHFLWHATAYKGHFGSPNTVTAIAASADGEVVYAVGYAFPGTAVTAMDADTGRQLWSAWVRRENRIHEPRSPHAAAASTGHTVFVTDEDQDRGDVDYATIAYH